MNNNCEAVLVNTAHPNNSELQRALRAFLFPPNKDMWIYFLQFYPNDHRMAGVARQRIRPEFSNIVNFFIDLVARRFYDIADASIGHVLCAERCALNSGAREGVVKAAT